MPSNGVSLDREVAIERICREALARESTSRVAFVAAACGTDPELRRQVEAALAHAVDPQCSIETAALEIAALAADGSTALTVETVTDARGNVVENCVRTAASREVPPSSKALHFVDRSRYHIVGERGRGGLGRILAARDVRLDREVAIKELLTDHRAELADRFVREAQLTARLEHPGVVPVHEAGRWPDGRPFYAMKMVTGRSLFEMIAERHTLVERLALLPNVIAVGETVAYAHNRRVIHRDIKPRNVMVGQFGETVVIDWGLAKDLASSDSNETGGPAEPTTEGATTAGTVLGTPAYMPPEQAAGLPVDERADVYALGALLFHVLAGKPPYERRASTDDVLTQVLKGPPLPVENHVAGVPTELTTIVRKAMAREKDDRYPSAKELVEDIKRFQTGQMVGAHQYTAWQLLSRYVARHWLTVGVATVAALAALVVGAMVIEQNLRTKRMIAEKRAADRDVAAIESQIDAVSSLAIATSLEEQLRTAVAHAQRIGGALETLGLSGLAGPPGDEFDARLHEVLASLDADSYSIPPSFRENTRQRISQFVARGDFPLLYARREKVWPVITRELDARGLPNALGYVAWQESWLDSTLVSPLGVRPAGLWQLQPDTARRYGLRVDNDVDERTDAIAASRAAARIFADLFSELGDDGALLAIAAYAAGDNRFRELLHDLAQEKGGWRRGGRGFWHVYRLKTLSAQLRDYVPYVIAFAIIDREPARYVPLTQRAGTVH
jgi:hypothetical protein